MLQIVGTLDPSSGSPCVHDGWHDQGGQHGDDRDHHQQFDQGKAPAAGCDTRSPSGHVCVGHVCVGHVCVGHVSEFRTVSFRRTRHHACTGLTSCAKTTTRGADPSAESDAREVDALHTGTRQSIQRAARTLTAIEQVVDVSQERGGPRWQAAGETRDTPSRGETCSANSTLTAGPMTAAGNED